MKIGITGGTGFLGRHLVRRLVDRGDQVVNFTRTPRAASSGVITCRWRLDAEPIPPEAVTGLDALIHLAGESVAGLWTAGKKERIRESRILGTRHLVQGLRSAPAPPRILLSSSASGFYGDGADRELTEDSPGGRGFLAEVSRGWEEEAQAAGDVCERIVLLRTSLPLAANGGLLQNLLTPFRLGLGGKIGSGRQWMPWIHIEDWVSLVLFALDRDTVAGPVNLTGPNPVPNSEFTRILGDVLGRPTIFSVPAFVLRLALREAATELALQGQRVLPEKAIRLGFQFRFPDLKPALEDLLPD